MNQELEQDSKPYSRHISLGDASTYWAGSETVNIKAVSDSDDNALEIEVLYQRESMNCVNGNLRLSNTRLVQEL